MFKVETKSKIRTKYDIAYSCMLFVAFLIIIGTGTYAYYRSTMTGTTSGTIAKWSFTANNQATTININYDGLYPGKTDVKYIELSAENSDLPVVFAMIINFPKGIFDENLNLSVENVGKLTEAYPITTLYFDNSYTHGINSDGTYGLFGLMLPGEKMTVPLYYYWPYEREIDLDSWTNDSEIQDKADGRSVSNGLTIIARQLSISNEADFNNSGNDFVMDINTQCALNGYEYSNKFGFPCEAYYLIPNGETIHVGAIVDYEFTDGTVAEYPKYMTTGLNLTTSD